MDEPDSNRAAMRRQRNKDVVSISGCSGLSRMQATQWPGAISRSSGFVSAHSLTAHTQRVRNRQPLGGLIEDGASPARTILFRRASTTGSGAGAAAIKALVYGINGRS